MFYHMGQNGFTKEQRREFSLHTALFSLNPGSQQVGLSEADVIDPCPYTLHLEYFAPFVSLKICGNVQKINLLALRPLKSQKTEVVPASHQPDSQAKVLEVSSLK